MTPDYESEAYYVPYQERPDYRRKNLATCCAVVLDNKLKHEDCRFYKKHDKKLRPCFWLHFNWMCDFIE